MRDLPKTVSSKVSLERIPQKFTLPLGEGFYSESVVLPMHHYSTLCLSSQLGCARACAFCKTGEMGLKRNLTFDEIMAQIYYARETLGVKDLQNIVFMGMGEPFDNFDRVIEVIDLVSHNRGDFQGKNTIPKRRISISTAGHAKGIERLTKLCESVPQAHYHTLHLSLSLHSPFDDVRSKIMPINTTYNLDSLREVLLKSPYVKRKDGLYIEYLLLPGINNRREDFEALLCFLEGMEAKINIASYNPGVEKNPLCREFKRSSEEQLEEFKAYFIPRGYPTWIRRSQGDELMGACGQLGQGD